MNRIKPTVNLFVCLLTLVFLGTNVRQADAVPVLVDHYAFEGNALDSAGPAFANGAVGANVTFVAGQQGQAARFLAPGTANADIDVPLASAFNPGAGDFAYAFWVKRDNPPNSAFMGIFDALSGTNTGMQASFLNNANGNLLRTRMDVPGTSFALIDTQFVFDDTLFHHVVLNVDRANNTAQYFIDGVAETALDISILGSGTLAPTQILQIGSINSTNETLGGSLDELMFFTGNLNQQQIDSLIANGTISIPEPMTASLLLLATGVLVRRRRLIA